MNKKWIQYGVLFMSLGFILFGVYRKEIPTVFQKAINICLECIGIG